LAAQSTRACKPAPIQNPYLAPYICIVCHRNRLHALLSPSEAHYSKDMAINLFKSMI
jgi:hypothetical protein